MGVCLKFSTNHLKKICGTLLWARNKCLISDNIVLLSSREPRASVKFCTLLGFTGILEESSASSVKLCTLLGFILGLGHDQIIMAG